MYSIGQFSLMTRLSVRTLRKYHENGLLIPDYTDEETGYRYYGEQSIERAQVITGLRSLDFSLKDIQSILQNCSEDDDMLDHLLRQKGSVSSELKRIQDIQSGLELVINQVRDRQSIPGSAAVQVKEVPAIWIAGLEGKGSWSEIGQLYKSLGRTVGRYIGGSPMSLCMDGEYRDEANYEAAFPLRKEVQIKSLCRKLPGIRCVSVIHQGPYSSIGTSYERGFSYISQHSMNWQTPTREIYHKGPGMIFKGNPAKYITEIQIPVH